MIRFQKTDFCLPRQLSLLPFCFRALIKQAEMLKMPTLQESEGDLQPTAETFGTRAYKEVNPANDHE